MMWMIPLSLLAMGIGYFVALKATEEIGFLKHLGNSIAGIMIAGSLLGMAWAGYLCVLGKMGYQCPFQKTASHGQTE
jgi:uncharacterized membrane protein